MARFKTTKSQRFLGQVARRPLMSSVMADPFELRLFFSNRLRALNPCEDTTDEVVAFALKHRDLDEDLWNCVLEQLENVSSIENS